MDIAVEKKITKATFENKRRLATSKNHKTTTCH